MTSLTLQADGLETTNRAQADIQGPDIQGTLDLTEYNLHGAKYVHLKLSLTGDPAVLTPGEHAVHFHEASLQSMHDFQSAGGHFDPGPAGDSDADANHGYHSGDLPSITINKDGNGTLEAITTRITLSDGPVSLLSPDAAPRGTSIMIHANPDPFTPGESGSGHSGGPRLAAGTITAA